jgi:hypothetical protein
MPCSDRPSRQDSRDTQARGRRCRVLQVELTAPQGNATSLSVALVMVDLPWVAAIVQRIAADVDELARARCMADLGAIAALPDRQTERRRVAEPDWDFWEQAAPVRALLGLVRR